MFKVKRHPWAVSYGNAYLDRTVAWARAFLGRPAALPPPRNADAESGRSVLVFALKVSRPAATLPPPAPGLTLSLFVAESDRPGLANPGRRRVRSGKRVRVSDRDPLFFFVSDVRRPLGRLLRRPDGALPDAMTGLPDPSFYSPLSLSAETLAFLCLTFVNKIKYSSLAARPPRRSREARGRARHV